jgi:hypothetical protein
MSTLAVFVALGGGAFAATKFVGSGGVVRLCVTRGGAVRVLKVGQKCGNGKTVVSLNQTGPQGTPGQRGATGPQGLPGPSGNGGGAYTAGTGLTLTGNTFGADMSKLQARVGACAADQLLQSVNEAGSPTCVRVHAYSSGAQVIGNLTAALAVPAGNWVVIGQETVNLTTGNASNTLVCNINQNGSSIGHATESAPPNQPASVAPVALATTTGPNTALQLVCDTGGQFTNTPGASLFAIPVAAVN